MYGYHADDMIGRPIAMIVAPEEREALRAMHDRIAKGERVAHFESRRFARDGRALDVSLSLSPIRDAAGQVVGIAAIERDVTAQKRAAQALARSQASLANAQRIAHLGNWDWDIRANELAWSDEIYRIFGVEPGAFEATYDAFLAFVHPADRDAVQRAVTGALDDGTEYAIDHRIVRPDGGERIVHEQAEVARDAAGRPLRMCGTVQDITELRRAQAEAAARAADLAKERELSALKSDFVNSVSHELRSPLTAIVGYGELLEDQVAGPLNADQAGFVQRLGLAALQLQRLVDDLLDAARIDAGTFKLRLEPCDPGLQVREVLAQLAPQLDAAGLTLEADVVPAPRPVLCDSQRIGQVLTNLIGNAIKFTPKGGTITVRLRWDAAGARFEVRDTGVGIAPEDVPKLFQRFGQLAAGKKRGGTGLGLAISKTIVVAHGGEIGVESAPGTGSTFWFSLPHAPSPQA